ncbi:MAG: bifunctional SulP family inorganic anion transporter/carbonic anhydrase [Parachlamydiaceae bacterium]|nr:bifunctional SulP family inorganic anion transporter/carbonic anhydrase [Parachlamydiaceae bacterium]
MQESVSKNVATDLLAGFVVFLVALPLCLGIALASNAPICSGIIGGIVGGLVVGAISGSSTSVSGPAAGLTAVIAAQIALLDSFEAFLAAVVLAGIIQLILCACRLGFIAAFFPSSVIKGLLWAIGIILILKQIPHIFGHDADPIGNKSFHQIDNGNTFSGIIETLFYVHPGATLIGISSICLLIFWDKIHFLKQSKIPAPIVVIAYSVILNIIFQSVSENWVLDSTHLVQVPVIPSMGDTVNYLTFPDFNILNRAEVYTAAITIAFVASLETLLNLEAVDKLDPLERKSSPNRELLAQGVGNIVTGLIGGLPVTSVIVRSSVNINAGVKTKLSTLFHGFLILGCVLFIPDWLNKIPLSALAAILLVTGLKLANPKMVMQMWKEGKNQFLPFILTTIAIVLTDLLIGVLIGLGIAICFILQNSIKRPIKKIMEKYAGGDEVVHIVLPNQVSFFNRASLESAFKNVPSGKHVLIDANNTDYIDPDILGLILDFETRSKSQKISVSLVGFKDKYPQLEDHIQFVDVASKETQKNLTPERVLEAFKEGNLRFRQGVHLTRDLNRQLHATCMGQYPMAVVLSCIDSRSPVELIFDLSIGDIFSVRIGGNILSRKVLGSIEYACAIAGAKMVLVLGHTSCGAVKASVEFISKQTNAEDATGCGNLGSVVTEIQKSIEKHECHDFEEWNDKRKDEFCNVLAHKNVLRTMQDIRQNSAALDALVQHEKITIVGAIYNVSTAEVTFLPTADHSSSLDRADQCKILAKMLKHNKALKIP